jgi:hypothetical protein
MRVRLLEHSWIVAQWDNLTLERETMQQPWWKQLLIGLALFLAGYFMFGGGQIGQDSNKQSQSKVIQSV